MLVLAVAIFVKDAFDRFRHKESVGRWNEIVQQAGNPASAAHAAGDITAKPSTPFFWRAIKPTSLTVAPGQSRLHAANAILYLRGSRNESGSVMNRSVRAIAYGATSNLS